MALAVGLTEGRPLSALLGTIVLMSGIGALAGYPAALYYRFRRQEPVKFSDWGFHGSMIGGWVTAVFMLIEWIVGTLSS